MTRRSKHGLCGCGYAKRKTYAGRAYCPFCQQTPLSTWLYQCRHYNEIYACPMTRREWHREYYPDQPKEITGRRWSRILAILPRLREPLCSKIKMILIDEAKAFTVLLGKQELVERVRGRHG